MARYSFEKLAQSLGYEIHLVDFMTVHFVEQVTMDQVLRGDLYIRPEER